MILTLYYMAATCMQWYRLKRMKSSFSNYLAICNVPSIGKPQPSTSFIDKEPSPGSCNDLVVISTAPPISKGIILYRGVYDSTYSENQKLGDLLCYEGDSKCCTVIPEKRVDLSIWIGFTKGYSTFPFEIIEDDLPNSSDSVKNINLLLQASIEPTDFIDEIHSIRIENIGIPIAWKVDNVMALIIRTDMQLFTSLAAAFMAKNIAINNHLQLLRIETVSLSGKVHECRPKDVLLGIEWFKKLVPRQWNTHVVQLRNLCSHIKHKYRDDYLSKHQKKLTSSSTSKHLDDRDSKPESSRRLKSTPGSSKRDSKSKKSSNTDYIPSTSVPNIDMSDETHTKRNKLLKKHISSDGILDDPKPKLSIPSSKDKHRKSKHSDKSAVVNVIENPLDDPVCINQLDDSVQTESNPLDDSVGTKPVTADEESKPLANSTSNHEVAEPKLTEPDTKNSKIKIPDCSKILEACKADAKTVFDETIIKPPNILIYADSAVEREHITNLLNLVLEYNKYTVYALSPNSTWWGSKAQLLIVCGAVVEQLGQKMLDYLLNGGQILCLCSDFINTVLPTYTTAEVRERELVRFSYERWHRIRMIHHIFCYQPSPGRKLFSKDSSEEVSPNSNRCPSTSIIEIKDSSNRAHKLEVKILGTEDTWHTPSLISASNLKTGGTAVFSQVHLEVEPNQYNTEDNIFEALKESNTARLDIMRHILKQYFDIHVFNGNWSDARNLPDYEPAFFLGKYELKVALLERLAPNITDGNILKTSKISMQFCGHGVEPISKPNETFLPVMVHHCPQNFSTFSYFENLRTEYIGRLVLYTNVIGSTMDVFSGVPLEHGMAAIAKNQLKGVGRGANRWIGPEGCAMFTLQLHIPTNTILGQRPSMIQILSSIAIVHAVRSIPGYEAICLNLKWPNDIYANKRNKVGGMVVTSTINATTVVCNIGIGINLNNENPTTSINELIRDYNSKNNGNLPTLELERFLAEVFNVFEEIYQITMDSDNMDYLYRLYYMYWLHSNADITILSESGTSRQAKVIGIDEFGYIKVISNGEEFSVQPDGNSFDMLIGLIAPKLK